MRDLTRNFAGGGAFIDALCAKYGSDKGSLSLGNLSNHITHTYTTVYAELLRENRDRVRTVFECGLGMGDYHLCVGVNGKPGASLRVWRDYFPNAEIWGADIDRDILFTEDRIKTGFIDQRSPATIKEFFTQTGNAAFDLMIDDGLHEFNANRILFENAIDRLANDGIYVVEDVVTPSLAQWQTYFDDKKEYLVTYFAMNASSMSDNNLVVIRKKANESRA
ncbi:hypothetical protein FACS1894139_16070 [Planctomycetales bacterium]|nr:hypothetical protein FACS1894139_16070 [Planctomycetales bacterium]